jgi:alanine dehydrogenase
MSTLLLTQKNIQRLLAPAEVVAAVEDAFVKDVTGAARMPSKVYLALPEFDGDFRAMPAYLDGFAGIKWVNAHPGNPEKFALPSVMAMFILNDAASARPLCVMDGTLLTAVRTGAAGAVASKYLCPQPPKTMALVGAGVQAHHLIESHRVIYPNLELWIADRSPERAKKMADEVGGRVVSVEEAAKADILCTATPSRSPIIQRSWLGPTTHVNAMGADAPGKQELASDLVKEAYLIVDSVKQASGSGEVNVPLSTGAITKDDIDGTLGELVTGKIKRPGQGISVFDSTGLAIQDIAVARVIYERAKAEGVGVELDFLEA